MRVTPHFSLADFACHDGTPYPVQWIDARLRPLCELLEIVRGRFGAPVTVISGYRTPAHNRRVQGARRSQHVEGRAADIRVRGVAPARVHDALRRLYDEPDDDRVRRLLGGLGRYASFTHVDVRRVGRLVTWRGKRIAAEVSR